METKPFKMPWKTIGEYALYAVLALIAINSLIAGLTWIVDNSTNSGATTAENNIIAQCRACRTVRDNQIKSVLEKNEIRKDFEAFSLKLINGETLTPQEQAAQQALNQAISTGSETDTKQFLLALGAISGTDYSSAFREVQLAIGAARNAISNCDQTLYQMQNQYRTFLGYDASNEYRGWNGHWAKRNNFPSVLKGELAPTEDRDGDGKLTVLDLTAPISIQIAKEYQTGVEGETPADGMMFPND